MPWYQPLVLVASLHMMAVRCAVQHIQWTHQRSPVSGHCQRGCLEQWYINVFLSHMSFGSKRHTHTGSLFTSHSLPFSDLCIPPWDYETARLVSEPAHFVDCVLEFVEGCDLWTILSLIQHDQDCSQGKWCECGRHKCMVQHSGLRPRWSQGLQKILFIRPSEYAIRGVHSSRRSWRCPYGN